MTKEHEGVEHTHGAKSLLPRPLDVSSRCPGLCVDFVVRCDSFTVNSSISDGCQIPFDTRGEVLVLRLEPGKGDALVGDEPIGAIEVGLFVWELVGKASAKPLEVALSLLLARVFVNVDVRDQLSHHLQPRKAAQRGAKHHPVP